MPQIHHQTQSYDQARTQYTIWDFIGPPHGVPVAYDRIVGLSLIVEHGLKKERRRGRGGRGQTLAIHLPLGSEFIA